MVVIEESEMRFGEYPDNAVFHIERSPQYQERLMPNGVKSCEFILHRENALLFVEAKKSCPNQITADSPSEKIEKYHAYIADITNKMRHSLSLYANILLKRYDTAQLSDEMLNNDLSGMEIKLVLVVKGAEAEWLIPLRDKLDKEMKRDSLIWKCSQFYVINEDIARRKHLVI